MLRFDRNKGVLTAGKFNPVEDFTPITSSVYEDYQRFLNGGLQDVIEEMFDYLGTEIGGTFEHSKVDKVEVKPVCDEHYQVDVSLFNPFLQGSRNFVSLPFTLMNLPFVRKDGSIKNEAHEYGFIHYLENKPGIYFAVNEQNDRDNSKKNIKLVLDSGLIITFMFSSNSDVAQIKVKISSKNFEATNVGYALLSNPAQVHYMDGCFRDVLLDRHDEEDYIKDQRLGYLDESKAGFSDAIKALREDEKYIISSETRKRINKILSFDRAIGQTLSDDVLINDGSTVLFKEGTLVTEEVVEELNKNKVTVIFVKDLPNVTGTVLRENVKLYTFKKGSYIIDEIRDLFPEYSDLMYLPRDIYWKDENRQGITGIFFFQEGEHRINMQLLNFLQYNGIKNIKVARSTKTKTVTQVHFSREIINNAQFDDGSGNITYHNFSGSPVGDEDRLTGMDVLSIVSLLISLARGNDFHIVEDLDISYCKRYAELSEKMRNAMLEVWKKDYVKIISWKLKNNLEKDITQLDNPKYMRGLFNNFYKMVWQKLNTEYRCMNMIDTLNPLAYLSSLRQVKTFVKDTNAVSANRRYMSMYQLGRICPYETPSSGKVGLTGHQAMGMKIINGEPMARYYKVTWAAGVGKIETDNEVYLTVEQEAGLIVTSIDTLPFDLDTMTVPASKSNTLVMARVPNPDANTMEKCSIGKVPAYMVQYVTCTSSDHLSIVVGTLPLAGSNDAVRVSFDASMMKQARGLITPEAPLIYTDTSRQIFRYTDKYCRFASDNGTIMYASNNELEIEYDNGGTDIISLQPLEICAETVIERQFVKMYEAGDRVRKNELLVTTNFDDNGVLATGKNVLIGFLPKGKNYEDGVLCSSRIRQYLASYRLNKHTEKFRNKLGIPRKHDVYKFSYVNSKGKIAKVHFGIKSETDKVVKAEKELGFCVDFSVQKDTKQGKRHEEWSCVAKGLTANMLGSGDKLANRHGNKGVVPKTSANSDMPVLPNGEFLDIAYNPHGVVSRMNVGQTLECNATLAARVLGIKIETRSFGGITTDEIKTLLAYAHDMANSEDSDIDSIINEYSHLPSSLHAHVKDRIRFVRYWKGCFSKEGTAILYNPSTDRMYNSDILIGFNYICKLQQDSDTKLNARSYYIGNAYKASESPTKGASNGGGQTLGNMEFGALLAYGTAELLNEMTNERGDNPIARVNFTIDKIHEDSGMKVSENMSMRRSVLKFLMIMEALGARIDIDELGSIYGVNEADMCFPTDMSLVRATEEEILKGPKVELDDLDDKTIFEDQLAALGIGDLSTFKI